MEGICIVLSIVDQVLMVSYTPSVDFSLAPLISSRSLK